jgi:hypothetical protein
MASVVDIIRAESCNGNCHGRVSSLASGGSSVSMDVSSCDVNSTTGITAGTMIFSSSTVAWIVVKLLLVSKSFVSTLS